MGFMIIFSTIVHIPPPFPHYPPYLFFIVFSGNLGELVKSATPYLTKVSFVLLCSVSQFLFLVQVLPQLLMLVLQLSESLLSCILGSHFLINPKNKRWRRRRDNERKQKRVEINRTEYGINATEF